MTRSRRPADPPRGASGSRCAARAGGEGEGAHTPELVGTLPQAPTEACVTGAGRVARLAGSAVCLFEERFCAAPVGRLSAAARPPAGRPGRGWAARSRLDGLVVENAGARQNGSGGGGTFVTELRADPGAPGRESLRAQVNTLQRVRARSCSRSCSGTCRRSGWRPGGHGRRRSTRRTCGRRAGRCAARCRPRCEETGVSRSQRASPLTGVPMMFVERPETFVTRCP